MTPKIKTQLTLAFGICIAIVFLLLALRDTALEDISASLANADLRYIPAISLALLLQFWFKALRWKLLLRPFSSAKTSEVFPATVVGYLANLVFPLSIGEFARVYLLAQHLKLRYPPVLATVILERIFDFLSVLFFVGIVLILDRNAPPELTTVGLVASAASVGLITAIAIFMIWTDELSSVIIWFVKRWSKTAGDKIAEQIELGKMGLQSIRDPKNLPAIVVTSLLQWGAMGICVYAGMLGTGLNAPVSAGFVVLGLTVMGVTIPSSPGFFGTIQLCFTIGLAAYGIAASEAFAASVLFHLTIYVSGWAAGLYFLRASGMSLGGLRQATIDQEGKTASSEKPTSSVTPTATRSMK